MVFLGFPSFATVWAGLWQVIIPENPQLAAALNIIWAVASPAKGAFFVMAVFGLRSKNPSTRTALFASMALVPPLNIVFPFRQQGFLLGPVVVAMTLSIILWGSFFLFRERLQQPEQRQVRGSGRLSLSRWEIFQYVWFAAYSVVLTLMAFLFLFWPRTALNLVFPWLSSLPNSDNAGLSSLILASLGVGTHLLALATGSWIATVNCRSNPTLRQALTVASTAHAGLFFVFSLPQVISRFGGTYATSSILIAFVPLFVCWLLCAIVDTTRTRLSTGSWSRSYLSTSSLKGKL